MSEDPAPMHYTIRRVGRKKWQITDQHGTRIGKPVILAAAQMMARLLAGHSGTVTVVRS